MATISQTYTFVAGAIPTAAQWNSNWTTVINAVNGNLDADNVDTTAVATLATANTWTADQTFNDSVKVSLGSSGDADLYYDGTDVILNTAVLGTGDFVITGGSAEFDDSEGVTLGTGKDATLQYDGTNVVLTTDAVGSGVLVVSNSIRSDTASTDDLGTTGVRWANLYVDDITVTTSVTAGGVITGATVEATGDTSLGDNAAMGYTATEGLILTGQGSTNDVTIKNDADTAVISIPTGATGVTFAGTVTSGGNILSDTDSTDDLGTTGVRWANLYVDDITATTSATIGTANIVGGTWTDSSGAISFGNENLSTTGTLSAGATTVTSLLASSNDVGAIGASGTAFSDLFLASGGVVNFNAGDVTLTHASNTLAMQGGSFVIGSATAQQAFEVKDGNIALTDTDVSQPMTALIEGNAYARIQPLSATAGGLDIVGASDSDAVGMDMRAYIGSSNPTDTTPAMRWRAGKSDGGTNIAALGASETAYQWTNFNTSTVYMSIYGSGSVVVGNGAIATTATGGFLYIPSCAGTPTGTPTDYSNQSAIVHDTTNNRIYLYDHVSNAWQYAALT